MDDSVNIREAYIEDNVLHGVTVNNEQVASKIVRGAHVMELGDIYNTEAGHYKVETIKEQ